MPDRFAAKIAPCSDPRCPCEAGVRCSFTEAATELAETVEATAIYLSDLLAGNDSHETLREAMYAARDGLGIAARNYREAVDADA
jgi:hypothetical protein